jgi:hypothetical protein
MRAASENSTSASVASASTRNDPVSGEASIQPRPSVPTTRPEGDRRRDQVRPPGLQGDEGEHDAGDGR